MYNNNNNKSRIAVTHRCRLGHADEYTADTDGSVCIFDLSTTVGLSDVKSVVSFDRRCHHAFACVIVRPVVTVWLSL